MRLYGFAHACQTLLGFVPQAVGEAIDPDLPSKAQQYMTNVKAARERERKRYALAADHEGLIDPNPTRSRPFSPGPSDSPQRP
jgi:hypothetical protein